MTATTTGRPPIPARRRTTLALGPVGLALPRRVWTMALAVIGVLVAATVAALFLGTLTFGADRVAATLLGTGTRIEQLVIVEGRLVRAVGALLVGFGLGMSGALTQSITRNPIASPDILGVTAGASAVAVFFVTNPGTGLGPSDASATSILTPAALAGGLLTTALILALAWRGGFDGMRLVLVGLGVNAVALAAISWMMTRATTDGAAVAARWLSGSVAGMKAEDLVLVAPVVLAGAVACLALSRSVASLRVGRDVAASLGVRTGRTELAALGVAIVAASVVTAVAGPIGFVAFVAPQAALRLFRTAGPTPFAAGLVGAAMLVLSDLVAQHLLFPLPVGVVTSVVGAPCLLLLIVTHLRRSSV